MGKVVKYTRKIKGRESIEMVESVETLYIYIYILAGFRKAFVLLPFLYDRNLNRTC